MQCFSDLDRGICRQKRIVTRLGVQRVNMYNNYVRKLSLNSDYIQRKAFENQGYKKRSYEQEKNLGCGEQSQKKQREKSLGLWSEEAKGETKVYEQGYRYYNPITKQTYITMDVMFVESEYLFSSSPIFNSSLQGELYDEGKN